MLDELTQELLDLTATAKSSVRASYAARLPACCCCSCCQCLFNCSKG
jgi:hypothetical protein